MAVALARDEWQQVIDLSRTLETLAGDPSVLDTPVAAGASLLSGIFVSRGRAQAQLGMVEEAEASFRREIELSPRLLSAYTNLALLYAVLDRGPRRARPQEHGGGESHAHAYAEAVRTLDFIGDRRSAVGLLSQALGRWPDDTELNALRTDYAAG